jgi:Zn-dependent protease
MERNSVYLFKVFGIPIRVHASWLVIFALITLTVVSDFRIESHNQWPQATYWIAGIIASLLFFVSVLLHELAHSVVARRSGMNVRGIVLFVFGGVSELGEEPGSAQTEFIMAFVGPLTSFVIGAVALLAWWLTRTVVNAPVSAVARYLGVINLLLGAFNLVPGFPLDGGRVLRSILWGITGDVQRATRWASRMGSLVAYALILVGVLMFFRGNLIGGIWFAFIGWFLNNAAQSSYANMLIKHVLGGHSVSEIVNRNCARVPPDLPMEVVVNKYVLGEGVRCLPVVEGERLAGLVTWQSVKAAPPEQWGRMRAVDAMIPIERAKTVRPDCDLWNALEQMNGEGVTQLAVAQEGQLVGLLTREAIMGFLQLHTEPRS